eukprot:14781325-Alexandrium_andersonii.AAC.1
MAGHSCGKALRASFIRMRWFVVTTGVRALPAPGVAVCKPRSSGVRCCTGRGTPPSLMVHHLAPHLRTS